MVPIQPKPVFHQALPMTPAIPPLTRTTRTPPTSPMISPCLEELLSMLHLKKYRPFLTVLTQTGEIILHPVIITTFTIFKCFTAADQGGQRNHFHRVDGDKCQEGSRGDGGQDGKHLNLPLRWGAPHEYSYNTKLSTQKKTEQLKIT